MRLLVFRGGALGDLLLTWPALGILRRRYPGAEIALFGARPHVALFGGCVTAVDDVNAPALAGLLVQGGRVPPEVRRAVGGADLAINYLADPDEVFRRQLASLGVASIIGGPSRVRDDGPHATVQLSAPVLELDGTCPGGWSALPLPPGCPQSVTGCDLALHPGSGSPRKNWPPQRWAGLLEGLHAEGLLRRVAVISGEADDEATAAFLAAYPGETMVWRSLPLPELAGRLAGVPALFGHDSGVSHLAAVLGRPTLALFGPTNPAVWAPCGPKVTVVRSPTERLADLTVSAVRTAAVRLLTL